MLERAHTRARIFSLGETRRHEIEISFSPPDLSRFTGRVTRANEKRIFLLFFSFFLLSLSLELSIDVERAIFPFRLPISLSGERSTLEAGQESSRIRRAHSRTPPVLQPGIKGKETKRGRRKSSWPCSFCRLLVRYRTRRK